MKNNGNVLIAGATSGIGRALCLLYLKEGRKVAVTGRRKALLEELKSLSPERVFTYVSDITSLKSASVIEQAAQDMGGIGTIIICSGVGHINAKLSAGPEIETVKTNVLGFTDFAAAAYNYFANALSHSGESGTLAGISSIASFRGSDLAPSYYASKAYVSNYLEGLRKKAVKNKLKLNVCTVIPGFVDTALAQGVGGNDGLFWIAPVDKAAAQIASALRRGKNIAYITRRWRLIAWLLKIIPDFIYNKI